MLIRAAEEAEFTLCICLRVKVFSPILEKLHAKLQKCLQAYAKLSHKFGFLHKVLHLSAKQLKHEAFNLIKENPDEFEPSFCGITSHF